MTQPDPYRIGPPDPGPVARLLDVGLTYGKTHALDGITLDLPAGSNWAPMSGSFWMPRRSSSSRPR